MSAQDRSEAIENAVRDAIAERTPLAARGGNTKAFYGRQNNAVALDVSGHRGVVQYEPTELVITARCGTPLDDIEATLAEQGQMLPFEPPHFGDNATIGGAVAAGLSGPRRPYAGAVRDNILGVTMINGRAEPLRFGGQVMKNVAGYDLSRLMAGSLGTLGVLLDLSIKVLPRPAHEMTLGQSMNATEAIKHMNEWAMQPLPVSATYHDGETLYVRLSGADQALRPARDTIGGDELDDDAFWTSVREQNTATFADKRPLWRISLPPATPPLGLPGDTLMEWNGSLRWLFSETAPSEIRAAVDKADGHAIAFRSVDRSGEVFHPLADGMLRLHQNLKDALDPASIFNPGRMYAAL